MIPQAQPLYYEEPPEIDARLPAPPYDTAGRAYLDCVNNVAVARAQRTRTSTAAAHASCGC